MTDNFKAFRQYIESQFELIDPQNRDDSYFVVELIRRGKDCPDLPAANYHFKNYYIRKITDLDGYEEEIKFLCDNLRMRAYISVSVKSFKQVTLDTLAELARRVANSDFKKNYNVYESCSGSYKHNSFKRWVVDIDNPKEGTVEEIIKNVNDVAPTGTDKVIMQIPTKSGVHLITTPFDVYRFNALCICKSHFDSANDIPDIKKNHVSLLYENL